MAPLPSAAAVVVSMSSAPTFSPQTAMIIGLAFVFVFLCFGITALLTCRYRRSRRAHIQAFAPRMVDLERQTRRTSSDTVKNGSRFLPFPPLAAVTRSWSGSTFVPRSDAPGKVSMDLPPPALAMAPSSRLRDSVLCKALGQLTLPAPYKFKFGTTKPSSRRIIDVEAAAADRIMSSRITKSSDPDCSLNYPEWIRPHLADIREQAKQEWTLYTPNHHLAVPEIVVQPCDDEPDPGSPGSTYSSDSDNSSELDTPPPMTPTLASPVSFYFPASPSFSAGEYLQVPPPSFHAPREEDKPVMRNVSNFSGKTFALSAPPVRSSKAGTTIKERRAMAKARAKPPNLAVTAVTNDGDKENQPAIQNTAPRIAKGCGTGPRVLHGLTLGGAQVTGAGRTGVGLGLRLQPLHDFQDSFDKPLIIAGPPDNPGTHSLSSHSSTSNPLDLTNVLETTAADVVFPPLPPRDDDDDPTSDADAAKERPEPLARLIDAFDSSFSLVSLDSGHNHLQHILDDYDYDDFDWPLDDADADESAVAAGVVVHESHARRVVAVYAL